MFPVFLSSGSSKNDVYWDWNLGNVPQSIDVYHDMTFRTFRTIIGLVIGGRQRCRVELLEAAARGCGSEIRACEG